MFKTENLGDDLIKRMSETVCDYKDWFSVARAYKLDPHDDYITIKQIMDDAETFFS